MMVHMAHGVAGRPDRRSEAEAGFSVAELVVVIAVIGILSVMTIPYFLSYYQAAAARANVQTVITMFNQARELAVRQNDTVCVTFASNSQMVLRLNSCGGAVWIGPGTDGAGIINLPQGFTIGPLNTVTFNYLGAAGSASTYTMTNSTTSATRTISIALTGRITSS
jgi:Tfp pilus assembly protein FimT